MQSGFVDWQAVDRSPQIENVATGAAVGMKALKDILAQVSREGGLRISGLPVDWTEVFSKGVF
jgi:hypothetical protein